ncbi:MAG: accessory factor UbiK family protein [Acetobacteraceae bacterium]
MGGRSVLDDVAGVAGGAISTLVGMRREIEAMARAAVEDLVRRLDLVPREEFEAVRDLAVRAREENERLERRLAELEARFGGPAPGDSVEGTAP